MNSKLFPSHKAIDPCLLSLLLVVDSGSKTFRFPREGWSVQWNETMSAAANAATTWPVAANSFCCRDCVLWFVLSSQLISINSTDVTESNIEMSLMSGTPIMHIIAWSYHLSRITAVCMVSTLYWLLGTLFLRCLNGFELSFLWCCFFYHLEHEVGLCSFLFHWCLLGGCLLQGTMRAPNRQSKSKGGMWTW